MIEKCKICGNEFIKKTYNQLYCKSIECKKEIKKISYIKDYEKHRQRCIDNSRKLRYTLNCVHCGNEFNSYNKTKVVCSDKCYRERMSNDRIGEGNPSYRNGIYSKNSIKKKIHSDGNNKFKAMCKKMNEDMESKYGYRYCESCGTNNSLRWEHHHIVFRSEKPGHEFLHNKLNTIHVCIKCHNEFHKNKSKRNNLMKERGLDKIFGIYIE